MSKALLTVSQVARRKGVDDQTVRRAIKNGRLAATWFMGQWAVDPASAEAWRPGRGAGVAHTLSPTARRKRLIRETLKRVRKKQ